MRKGKYIGKLQMFGSLFLLGILLLLPAQVHASETSCTVTLPITLSVTKNGKTESALADAAGKRKYEFLLMAEREDTPLPEQSQITIAGAGKAVFGPITYTQPGDYVYHISQKPGNEKDTVYDSISYTVLVQIVWDKENELEAEIYVTDDAAGAKTDQIEFNNLWKVSDNKSSMEKPQTVKVIKRTTAAKTGDELEIGSIFAVAGVTLSAVVLLSILMVKDKRKRK